MDPQTNPSTDIPGPFDMLLDQQYNQGVMQAQFIIIDEGPQPGVTYTGIAILGVLYALQSLQLVAGAYFATFSPGLETSVPAGTTVTIMP